jgi:NADH-quinone oxidoreductase subunit N
MRSTDILALLPLLLSAATAVIAMLAISIRRDHDLVLGLTLAGLAAAFISVCMTAGMEPRQVTALFIVDGYARFYAGLIIATAATVAVLAHSYFTRQETDPEEFYLLLLLATVGCIALAASSNFASFFLSLEILSVTLYAMVAYLTERKISLEAGIKYLILAGSSASFLLFGMALIYATSGTMDFTRLATIDQSVSGTVVLLSGAVLILTGLGFKLALVPFHLWTPDVYQGAPAPVTAFISTASKSAVFALLLRYASHSTAFHNHGVWIVMSVMAIASMLAGNLLALRQTDVKRILAYSSIAHLGYVLVALLAGGDLAAEAVAFYLVAYTVTSLGAFGVVTLLSTPDRDAGSLEEYRGLFWKRPFLAGTFTLMLLSLAGIPATVGFLAKFYVIATGADQEAWPLIIVLVVASAIGLFYYLRIIVTLYSTEPIQSGGAARVSRASGTALTVLTVVLIFFGIYPAPLLNLIHSAMNAMH